MGVGERVWGAGTNSRRQHKLGKLIRILRASKLPELAEVAVSDDPLRLFAPGPEEADGRVGFPEVL